MSDTYAAPISIKERLPEVNPDAARDLSVSVNVLFWSPRWNEWQPGYYDFESCCLCSDIYEYEPDATYWMPMPPPPA